MSSPVQFPSPIGGVPFDLDFIPSIIFAAAYGIISIGAFYRLARSASRTLVVLGTLAFTVERVVIYALRAKQAHTPSEDFDANLTKYWQISYAVGYLSVYSDLNNCLRCLFVKSTMGSTSSLLTQNNGSAEYLDASNMSHGGYGSPADEDQPRARFMYRRFFGFSQIFFFIPLILGIIAGYNYVPGETNSSTASMVQTFRYATSLIAFFFILSLQLLSLYGYFSVPRIRKSSTLVAFAIASLLNVVSFYRFVVMRFHTTSLTSMAPGSLNSTQSKTTFYIFHAFPEFLAAAIILNINVRERFSTGLIGDRTKDKKQKAAS